METITDPPIVEPAVENNPKHEDLRRNAEKWIAENPNNYRLFMAKASSYANHNLRFSAKSLAEAVRLEGLHPGEKTYGDYRINNNFIAYIARRLVEDIPEAARFLHFRKTRW